MGGARGIACDCARESRGDLGYLNVLWRPLHGDRLRRVTIGWHRLASPCGSNRQFADPHRQVDTLAHKIDEAIRLPHLDLDFAMGLEERRHDRHDMEAPEYDRRRHDEFASGREIYL